MTQVANINLRCDLGPVKLWQYTGAKKLLQILDGKQSFMDTEITDFWLGFHTDILNIQSCNAFGLALWGRLLNTPRPTYIPAGETEPVDFSDEQYRLVLRARIFLLTFNGSAQALNHFFYTLFPGLLIEIVDNYNMSVDINVISTIPPELKAVFQYFDFTPRPSGVKFNYNFGRDWSKTFGFEGMTEITGFDNGTFYQ